MSEQDNRQAFSPSEITIGEIWMEVLQLDNISPDINFFGQGGDSLTTMMMLFRVSDALNIEITPDVLMEAPTLREFCEAIDKMISEESIAEADYTETGMI